MKYMMLTFGSVSEATEVKSDEWIENMIEAMGAFNDELIANGEFVDAKGLSDPVDATTIRFVDGAPVPTDGPMAEAKESIAGYWILEVASHERAVEIAKGAALIGENPIELRFLPEMPPEE